MAIYKYLIFTVVLFATQSVFSIKVSSQDYYITYKNGLKIHLKEKKVANAKQSKVIVLINPLSIPSLEAFDVPGYSVMDTLAKSGFDVWGIDFIGQGKSSYPPEMLTNPAPTGLIILQAKDTVPQLNKAINYIVQKTGNKSVAMLGWSWGSVVAAMYAINHPKQVDHLVLYGAMYSFALSESAQKLFIKPYEAIDHHTFSTTLPAYQNISWKIIENHWKMMINNNNSIATQDAFTAVGNTYCKIDSHPFIKNTVRRPIGPMKDLYSIWNNQPIYDTNKLTVPTMVIYGDQDIFADPNLYSKLANVKIKQEVKLKEATHWLIYEKSRSQFNDMVIKFLNK